MTTADWAIVISLGSLLLSIASFVWNVWSKFIYPKPKVAVFFNSMTVLHRSGKHGEQALGLHGTNIGPGEVMLYAAIAINRSGFHGYGNRR